MPKFLVGCEVEGRVRDEMRAKGVDSYSCDVQPSRDGSPYHIQGDVREVMARGGWDGFGLHPPCMFLCVSGLHWNDRGRGWDGTQEALQFVADLRRLAGLRPFYLENPVSIISTHWRKPDQCVEPYEYGDDAKKKTCLWLQGLPLLVADPAQRVPGRWVTMPNGRRVERWANQTDSGQNKLGPSADRAQRRSATYRGIARAMAAAWAPILSGNQNLLLSSHD